jgi:integrase
MIDVNPAHAVRGPKYVVKKGKTPVLTADEARTLLDSIPIIKTTDENGVTVKSPDLMGLRDRALIGLMAYSFARVGAVLQMKVGDYFVQGRRRWVRLHEKGGKEHDVPCHHNLDHFLDEYLAAAGIAGDADGYLFRTTVRRSGVLTEKPMHQQDAYRMIQRRAKVAGIETKIGNHTFRATGITAYLKNSGKLEVAQHIANHESPRTTKLYDRRNDEISLDEIERIAI